MRIITMRQPEATALFTQPGPRRLPTKTVTTGYRGPVAVVAGKPLQGTSLPVDFIVGLVELVDVHQPSPACDPDVCAPWPDVPEIVEGTRLRPLHWVVEDIRPIPEGVRFPYRGFYGFGVVKPAHAAALERAVAG